MKIDIQSRLKEAQEKLAEYLDECKDLQNLSLGFSVLAHVSNPDTKEEYNYTQAEYDLLESKIRSLCAKHEIVLPEYVEWNNIEIN